MGERNQVGDIISGFKFNDVSATRIRKDGSWSQGHEVEVEAKGEWLVVEAYLGGGGRAMFNDYYPDVWHIVLQKLGPRDRTGFKSHNVPCSRKTFEHQLSNPREVRFTKKGLRPQVVGRRITVTQDNNSHNNCIPYFRPVGQWEKVVEVKWFDKE